MMEQRYYIVAANYEEYNDWLNSGRPQKIIPEYTTRRTYQIKYVSSTYTLRGLSDIKGFYIPGCERHPEYNEIRQQILIIKSKTKSVSNTGAIGGTITGVILDEWTEEYNENFTGRFINEPCGALWWCGCRGAPTP